MTDVSDVREWVYAAVSGDVQVVARLATVDHRKMAAAFQEPELILTRDAVLRALLDYQRGQLSDSELHDWAWFVRRGYASRINDGPVSPIHIDYEHGFEEPIVATLERFSELGDTVDGTIEPAELDELVCRLVGPSGEGR
jgi:hypothetical protein